jgi:hypothetical protein
MTKWFYAGCSDDDYKKLVNNMDAEEKAEHIKCLNKNAEGLAKRFGAHIEAQLQKLGAREPDDISCFPLSKISLSLVRRVD